jgi:membrane protein implicated in regulation of membrane protease activity
MAVEMWQMWLILAALFIIGEIFTAGFFLFWFGIGAAAASVLAILGFGTSWQWGAFVVVSGALFAVSRKFADKFTKDQPPGIGANRFLNKTGVVLEEIDNIKNTGQVRIGKDKWRADSASDEVIQVGELVKVTRLDGTHVVVHVLKEVEEDGK